MKVLYFGIYDPNYARNRVLINGLRKNGVEVVELKREPGRLSLISLFFGLLRLKEKFNAMIVGFPGQEAMFLARMLHPRRFIIFDAFTSHYGGYILDRKKWPEKSWRAKYYKFLDKWSCKLADLVLLDTNAHIDFFAREFKLPRNKFRRIFVGTDSDIFYPRESKEKNSKFLVHFHGSYVPLQGVRHIIKAAKLLEQEEIAFNLIGRGQTYDSDRELARKLNIKNINFIDRVKYEELPHYISQADACLGVFGDSPKTDLVIPNKIFEALAMGKPVITALTAATKELLDSGENVLFCSAADAGDLAAKIRILKNDAVLREKIAKNARSLFENKLTEKILGNQLLNFIKRGNNAAVLIAGYPYIKESYFKTFDFYPGKAYFLLPKIWKAKDGKLIFFPPTGNNIYTAQALFYHSNYPLVGGLFKGLMPSFPLKLLSLRIRKGVGVIYGPSEPILLTTLYQGFWSKIFGLKHILFTWENISYEKKFKGMNLFFKKIIINLNLFFCDGIVCGNNKAKDIFKRLTKKPIAVIPLSGVDADFFHKVNADNFLEIRGLKDKLIFSFAGAIGYRKGVHSIINAFKKVLSVLPNAHLVVAGTGEYEKEISELIIKLNLEGNATRISWLNPTELRELLSASHIFLYPSMSYGGWEEQFGYSMAEASLMELPIISTLSGSVEDVVVNGRTGLLVKSDDVGELEEAMIRLGSDSMLREKMGQAGRKYITENYNYQIVADKFYKFFRSL